MGKFTMRYSLISDKLHIRIMQRGEEYRICELTVDQLRAGIANAERSLGGMRMLYEMKALTLPAKAREWIKLDELPCRKRLDHRWTGLVRMRRELRKREKSK